MILNSIVKTIKRKSHRGNQAVTSDQITQDIVACVNEAIRDIQKLLPKRFFWKPSSFDTEANEAIYSLAEDVQELSVLYYFDGTTKVILDKIESDREWHKRISGSIEEQRPLVYREIGQDNNGHKQIELSPVPNGVYTIQYEYYKTKGADLTISDIADEVTIIPDYVQDVVEKGGLYYFLKGFDDPLGEVAKRDYEEAKQAFEIADERDLDKPQSIRMPSRRIIGLGPNFHNPRLGWD